MKYLPIVTAAALLASTAFLVARADDAETPAPTPAVAPTSAVVRVSVESHNTTICTGFYVGDRYVVTAGHCVVESPGATYNVTLDNGAKIAARVATFGSTDVGLDDWALLLLANDDTIKAWTPAPLDCSGKPPVIGTAVRTEGFPGTEESSFRVTWGRISGSAKPFYLWRFPVIPHQLAVAPGNSGGPLFRDSDNQVIGIVVAMNTDFTTYSISTPIGIVCSVLHR